MAIIQEAFDIPEDIATGLATGLFRRIGGVIRYAVGEKKGQIVTFLEPVAITQDQEATLTIVDKALEFGKQHKKLMIGAAVVAGTAAVGGGIYAGITAYKRNKFQKVFKRYIEAVRSGDLNVEIIEELESVLSNMKTVNMKADELALLIGHIRDYTLRLAENNNIDVEIKETDTSIIDLKQYLETQKSILKSA